MRARARALVVGLLAASPAAGQAIEPGLWETTAQAMRVEVPAMPGMAADFARSIQDETNARLARPTRQCWTAETLARDPANYFSYGQSGCKATRARVRGGTIDVAARCAGGADLTLKGGYTASAVRVEATITSAVGPQRMVVETRSDSRRIGPCEGGTR